MRKPLFAVSLMVTILATTNLRPCISQTQSPATSTENTTKPENLARTDWVLHEDTPVRLRLMQTLSSGTSKLNDKVDFEVIEEVKVNNIVVIAQGGTAIATVTEARGKKSFGRSGKLNVNIDSVRLANGEKATLRAVKGGSGGSRTGVMTGAVVATAIIFFPAAPLFFFIKGKNIIIPKGTEITAYVAADVPVSSFSANPGVVNFHASPSAADVSTIIIKSNPDGGEIMIDGKFMGTTPSTVKLAAGEHIVKITKSGHAEWLRTITLNAGSDITIDASLVKTPE